MERYQHEVLRTFALTHNYNSWIISMLKPYLGKNILEIGCGIGNLTFYLTKLGKLTCLDKSQSFIQHMKIDYPDIDFFDTDIAGAGNEILRLKEKNIDSIVCVNVLEHIEDDTKALENMYKILQPGGKLLVFVPALPLLYGSLDKNLDHFRRYSKKELVDKLEKQKFTIEKVKYNNFVGVFGWFINSRILGRKEFPILQPIIFDKFIPIITKIEKLFKIPFGMNLLIIANKP
ncbi:MAG: class I SAM-dependent methyltransferase [Elusimicrobia bacterium]|nr:class I SAM-dependent methyltransferase [Elusimicrobiota bacterium]